VWGAVGVRAMSVREYLGPMRKVSTALNKEYEHGEHLAIIAYRSGTHRGR
jgi:hypothetical protein